VSAAQNARSAGQTAFFLGTVESVVNSLAAFCNSSIVGRPDDLIAAVQGVLKV
jgi:hypothetical protein